MAGSVVLKSWQNADVFAIPEKKTCTKCKVEQPIANFTHRSNVPGHHKAQCRECDRIERAERTANKRFELQMFL